jgi:hypothetical protein
MQNQENPRHSNQNQSDEHGRRFGEEHRPEELEDDVENEDGHRPAREPNEDPLRPIGERSSTKSQWMTSPTGAMIRQSRAPTTTAMSPKSRGARFRSMKQKTGGAGAVHRTVNDPG